MKLSSLNRFKGKLVQVISGDEALFNLKNVGIKMDEKNNIHIKSGILNDISKNSIAVDYGDGLHQIPINDIKNIEEYTEKDIMVMENWLGKYDVNEDHTFDRHEAIRLLKLANKLKQQKAGKH